MSGRIRQHLRSNVVGYLALFVAVSGGTAYATHPGGANTIDSGDIINGEVRTADIGADAVTSNRIAPGGVFAGDLATNSVSSPKVVNGSLTGADVNESTLDASRVVARARGSSSVPVPSDGSSADYPLTGATWTQRANESDREFFGTVTFMQTDPPCTDGIQSQNFLFRLFVDGTPLQFSDSISVGAPGTKTRAFTFPASEFFEPGAATGRTLTASIGSTNCATPTQPVVTSVKVNVLGVS